MASGRLIAPHQQAGHMAAPTSSPSPSKIPCQLGAVHTWLETDILVHESDVRFSPESRPQISDVRFLPAEDRS
jgi:hypothetical protein